MDPTTTLEAVKAWPMEDQLDLVFRLWDQLLDTGWKPELIDDLKQELDRRLAAHKADPDNVVTWEDIVERVRKRR
jgi:putative addiction module component (TIGR02574 family)